MRKLGPVILLLAATARAAMAHDGEPPTPQTLWSDWHWESAIGVSLIVSVGLYAGGLRKFWRQVAEGRSALRWKRTLTGRALYFLAGLIVLGLALLSPLDSLSQALFSAHMSQHMLLILIAAPLLVLGDPPSFFLWIFPARVRRAMGQGWNRAAVLRGAWHHLTRPLSIWALHALALWAWHTPLLYQAALADELVHTLEHGSFLGTAFLFWWVIASPSTGRLDRGLAVLFLFTTALQSGLLAVLITFTSTPWYGAYSSTTASWGLSPLEDQQLAGAIMWIPAGIVYVLAAVILFVTWLGEIDRSMRQRESAVRLASNAEPHSPLGDAPPLAN